MSIPLSQFLEKFDSLTKKPVKFLCVQDDIDHDIKQLIKSMYDFTKLEERDQKQRLVSKDVLSELIVDEFDEEQIWQELDLNNNANLECLIQNVASCVSNKDLSFPVKQQVPEKIIQNQNTYIESEEHSSESDQDENMDIIKKTPKLSTKKMLKRSVVDDQFFKLNEMEKFLEQEDKKEMLEHKQRQENDSDEESIDLFEGSEEEDSDEEGNEINFDIKYNDFFDGPHNENVEENGNKSEEEYEMNEDDIPDIKDKSNSKKSVRFNLDNSESDNDSIGCITNNTNVNSVDGEKAEMSQHELRQQRLRDKIQKLEEKNLAEKPWQLKGEVDATKRPQNSLLEEVVDFDLTTRPAPIITEETTFKLEDIIKQRVKDKVWDDVERKAKPVPETHEFRKKIVLDQEKSKMSLAQVYEQEYLKQKKAITGNEPETEDEPEQHKHIRKSMKTLFAKLDALSNYHYTPKPAQAEVKIVSNIPAISMEEVAPVATSDAALLAPEEVKAKRKGELMNKNERTATDKKRERRKKKSLQRQKEKEKNKKENLINKLNPGLGNKYSKQKAFKLLDKVSKDYSNTEKMTQLNDAKTLKSSTAFFTQLNDDLSSATKSKKKKDLLPAKKYKL